MKLTDVERSTLMYLHMVLAKIGGPDAGQHTRAADIIRNGYYEQYPEECLGVMHETVPNGVMEFVHKVFEMYRALNREFQALPENERAGINLDKLKFNGFDENNETEYSFYAEFVHKKLGRWTELNVDDYNSHRPNIDKYREMLTALPAEPSKVKRLTAEQIKAVIEAPHVAAA